jgi:hypothetical protein
VTEVTTRGAADALQPVALVDLVQVRLHALITSVRAEMVPATAPELVRDE